MYMDPDELAKRIRDAYLQAAVQAYEDAGIQGLGAERRWEAAAGDAADTGSRAAAA